MNPLATPCATSSLPAIPQSSTRKRKRQDEPTLPPLPGPVTINAHPSTPANPFDPPPPTLTPATLLHRHLFPLQWLSGQSPKLFTAPALTPLDVGLIMIVKVEGERTLYAVEAVEIGVYALARLGNWVRLGDVRRIGAEAKKVGLRGVKKRPGCLERQGEEWWKLAALDFDSSESEDEALGWELDLDVPVLGRSKMTPPPEEELFREPKKEDILGQVKSQYFEAVYVAKTSIAYFAKSTLSRARVFFCDDKENDTVNKLVEFLESMVLPLEALDEKYKKTVFSVAIDEADTELGDSVQQDEVSYIRKWVAANFGEDVVLKKDDKALVEKVDELKTRETELQIILLLEILSLRKEHSIPEATAPADEPTSKKGKVSKKLKKKQKKAKVMNKETLLDLLVDRLCIWRSLGATIAEMLGAGKAVTGNEAEQDSLRHFCVEVVLAFYSSRLPSKCASISKKFNNLQTNNAAPPSVQKPKPAQKKRPLARSFTAPMLSSPSDSLASTLSRDLLGPKGRPSVRTGGVDTSKLAKREISVSTIKAKKDERGVMQELKDAIQALKKPNRVLHGISDAQNREPRLLFGSKLPGNGKNARKSSNPTRIPPTNASKAPAVLVAATPSKPRQRELESPPPGSSLFPDTPFASHALSCIPESSPFLLGSPIPDSIALTPSKKQRSNSTIRPGAAFMATPTRVRKQNGLSRSYTVGGIMSTPERSSILETPVRMPMGNSSMNSLNSIMETPIRRSSFGGNLKVLEVQQKENVNVGDENKGVIMETPVKAPAVAPAAVNIAPSISVPMIGRGGGGLGGGLGGASGDDLYKKLGWDDEEFVF